MQDVLPFPAALLEIGPRAYAGPLQARSKLYAYGVFLIELAHILLGAVVCHSFALAAPN